MAMLWKLPCIFLVENNHYAMGTSTQRGAANSEFYKRGDFVPGIRVCRLVLSCLSLVTTDVDCRTAQADGMDVLSSKHAALYAAEHARTKGMRRATLWHCLLVCCFSPPLCTGPIVLEMMTYRYVGHSMSDPGTTYRTRDEVDSVRKKQDPIECLRNTLLSSKLSTAEELKSIETTIRKSVEEALANALAAPEPELKELYSDIYKELVPVRTVERVNSYVPA
jgi:pyruvate dehydrogenase E1 component alpha subunit